jgi:hypothetical protein
MISNVVLGGFEVGDTVKVGLHWNYGHYIGTVIAIAKGSATVKADPSPVLRPVRVESCHNIRRWEPEDRI